MVISQEQTGQGYITLPQILANVAKRRADKQEKKDLRARLDKAVVGYDQNVPVTRGLVRQEITKLRRAWMGKSVLLPDHEPPGNIKTAVRAGHFALFLKKVARDLEERGLLDGQLPILAAVRYVRTTPRTDLLEEYRR